jgi:chromosomal replication initiation ATPase DnaA
MRGPLAAINLVSADFGVSTRAIFGPGRRSPRVALARQVAAYVCSVGLNHTPWRMAVIMGCHHSTVEHALRTLEDSRADGSAFDAWLTRLTDRLERPAG